MNSYELYNIGKIAGTHGWKGYVKIIPLTDFPERFTENLTVFLSRKHDIQERTIDSVIFNNKQILLKFKGIDTKEEAQLYNHALIQVEEKDLFPLPEGFYYHFQLIGLEVHDEEKAYLGKMEDIIETGANDVYVVNSSEYGEILIPAIPDVILDIDLNEKVIRVKLLPGLID